MRTPGAQLHLSTQLQGRTHCKDLRACLFIIHVHRLSPGSCQLHWVWGLLKIKLQVDLFEIHGGVSSDGDCARVTVGIIPAASLYL